MFEEILKKTTLDSQRGAEEILASAWLHTRNLVRGGIVANVKRIGLLAIAAGVAYLANTIGGISGPLESEFLGLPNWLVNLVNFAVVPLIVGCAAFLWNLWLAPYRLTLVECQGLANDIDLTKGIQENLRKQFGQLQHSLDKLEERIKGL